MNLDPIAIAGADEQAISQLLTSTTCDIESIFSFTSDEFYDERELRKRYRKIALLIHPDKSRNRNAESAFKILTSALEVLLARLHNDTNSSEGTFSASDKKGDCTSCGSKKTKSAFNAEPCRETNASDNSHSRRHREKDFSCPNTSTKGTKNEGKSSNFSGDKIRKCAEAEMTKLRESWAAAEKAFLSEMLKKKIDKEVRLKRKKIEKDESDRDRAVSLGEDCFEQQKDVENRANNWKVWSEKQKKISIDALKSSATSGSTIPSIPDDTHHKIRSNCMNSDSGSSNFNDHPSGEYGASNHEKVICSICQRLFSSFQALIKHENFSQLHRRNLVLVRADT